MHRVLPKIVVLAAIAGVVLAILYVNRRVAPPPDHGIIYVNPGFTTRSPPAR